MFGFFRRGHKRPLVEEDLYDVLPEESASVLVSKLQREWNKELEKSNFTGRPPSLCWALLRAFGVKFMLYGLPAFFQEVFLKMAQPVMLARLVLYFSTDLVSTTEAYLQAAGLSLSSLGLAVFHHWCFFGFARMGMRLRTACSALVFRKALKLSNIALGETTIGQLVNILSNDVNRFDMAFNFAHYLWIAPFQLIVLFLLCWREIGVSCLAGLSVLILMAPLQCYAGKLFSKLRSKTALLSDARLRIMNEVISGMRVIKIYAWEPSFGKLVAESRSKEIHKILHSSYLRALIDGLLFDSTLLTTFVTFVVYASLGNPVTSSKVFAVVSLFYGARLSLSLFFPLGVMNGAEGLVSIHRIQKFLLMEELERNADEATVDVTANAGSEKPAILLDEIKANGVVALRKANGESAAEDVTDASQRLEKEARTSSENYLIQSEGDQEVGDYVGPAGMEEDDDLDKPEPSLNTEDKKGIVVKNLYGSWNKVYLTHSTSEAFLSPPSYPITPAISNWFIWHNIFADFLNI
ncbi:multidrug resistance-associated protein 4-like [Acanthaster planci]|uniref:Multidrug resistance-associated protein 4-like n=1 Tax=Acanthaster planci TaxID=133434 RepID=A0A8B7YJI8_ACAPL|nr:multidrug resistance-associated protein 4-like [Acanthaster planci]